MKKQNGVHIDYCSKNIHTKTIRPPGLMGRYIKEQPLKEANSILKLLHLPLRDSSPHKDATKANVGFSAEASQPTEIYQQDIREADTGNREGMQDNLDDHSGEAAG